jgi:predicted amidophosphoribosyltransferase
MAFILVAGLPGLMAFGCVQEWPARVTCPHCQKRRVVDHETCEHCGAPFPPAEKNGTEIFEALSNELVSD